MDTCTRPFLSRIQRSTALLTLLDALLVVPAFAQQLQPIYLLKASSVAKAQAYVLPSAISAR
jgi:hypothetical protein